MTRDPQFDDHPLIPTLRVAASLWILGVRDMASTDRDGGLAGWRKDGRQALERADAVLFGSGKRGESADLFARFARAFAAFVHDPGGAAAIQTGDNRCQACLPAEQVADQPGDPGDGEEHL